MMKHIKKMIVVAGVFGLLLSPFSSAKAQEKVTLKVMCYNMMSFEGENKFLGYNITPMIEMIQYYDPDIICFQEFETDNNRVAYPASNEPVEKLTEAAEALGMFPYFGHSYDKGEHPDHYGAKGYYGNAMMSKYPIVEAHSSQLPFNGWDKADRRSVQHIDILVPTTAEPNGVKVRIVNTHLDNRSGQNDQAKDVISKTLSNSEIPALLMGDMNGQPGSAQIATYSAVCDRVCEDTPGTYGTGNSKLDYIFSYPKGVWEVKSVYVVKENAAPSDTSYPNIHVFSDHRPIVTVVELK